MVTRRLPRLRRRWIVLVVVGVLALGVVRLADKSFPIDYYRVIDDHTVVVGTISGPWTWTRVTTVTETTSSVTVGISSIAAPGPGFRDDIVERTVTLRDPIGDRTVIDASRGLPVRRVLAKPEGVASPRTVIERGRGAAPALQSPPAL